MPATANVAYENISDSRWTQNHGLSSTGSAFSTPGENAGIICRPTAIGRMKTPMARSSVVSSR